MSKTYLLIILLLSSTLGFGQIPNYVPSNGLIGWWPFTGNAQDLSGNGHHGTVTGATLTTDRFGAANNAYNFDGNDWITLDNLPQINGLNAITISVWVKSSGFNQNQSCNMGCRQFYFSRGANGQNGFYIQTDQNIGANVSNFTGSINGSFNTPQGGWAGSNVSTPIPHSTWHHVVLVYNGSTIRLFLNGVQQSSNSYTTNVQSSNSLAYFGRMDPIEPVYTYFTVGKIDDAGIWDRALTNQEISQLYNASPGTLNTLNCSSYVLNGALLSGQAASNVTLNLTYSGGNGGFYGGQSIFSTGVTGLTATIPSGTLANGNGSITYTISGTPSGIGNATFPISFGGQSCNVVIPITSLNNQYPPGTVFCANGPTAIVDVTNPTTGLTWMDRNLGASQVATSSTDPNAYGDLYQWGRFSDGHQCRTSPTTSALSSLDQPGNNMFILAPNTPYDWRSPQNTNLWQGVNGVNNPCPMGYRIPTETELDNERLSWGMNNGAGAFSSNLKLTYGGSRGSSTGTLSSVGSFGYFWSSTVNGTPSRILVFNNVSAQTDFQFRANGLSIRCIKETVGSIGALNCNGIVQSGTLYNGQPALNVTVNLPYTGGNGGYYPAQAINSTGVMGLTANISQGLLATGAGNFVFTINGTATSVGTATFLINIGGQSCSFSVIVNNLNILYPPGSVFCANGPTAIVDVINPTTGKTWMDRNLGASQVATSSTDPNAYGDLYQWGRFSDGHQCRTSPTTSALSSLDQPGNNSFILTSSSPHDWRSPQNTNLWQGVNGVNNPCPLGYRVPTEIELDNERLSWSSFNGIGAYASPLKWPLSGNRSLINGAIQTVGITGNGWSSTVNGVNSRSLAYDISLVNIVVNSRARGFSVRCIKETVGSIGAINCNGSIQSGVLYNGQPATSVTVTIPYVGGNGGFYPAQAINSTGVMGLTATISQGLLATGSGNFIFTINGTASSTGVATFLVNIGGQSCSFSVIVNNLNILYPPGSVFCANGPTAIVDVTNPTTGKTWMDRNLGASQVATSSTDPNAYGDLYQWGRFSDGHQCRTSPTTSALSSLDQPGNNMFILAPNTPYDWRSPQNTNLWQGVNGVNNPCPMGYRIPTVTELDNERLSWGSQNAAGAYNSQLKWTLTGYRMRNDGSLANVGFSGHYKSSTISGIDPPNLFFFSAVSFNGRHRAFGDAVRCIKETVGSIGALNCNGAIPSGNLYNGQLGSINVSVPYTGGNGGYYPPQGIPSTGVTGLVASLPSGVFASGAGSLAFTVSGTPSAVGTATFQLNLGGQSCSFTVNVLSFASITTPNDTLCLGQSTTITASVANAGTVTYSWIPGGANTASITVSPTTTTTYTCTVTLNGVSTTVSQTITVVPNPVPIILAIGPTTFCSGGSVVLTASSGNSYLWTPGSLTTQSITVNTSGSYSVVVTNANGCSATSNPITVTVNASPTPIITAIGPTTFCAGGSVVLSASTGNSYLWSNNQTTQNILVTASGTYAVQVTNQAGCSAVSAPVTVTVNPLPLAAIATSGPTSFCSGSSVVLTASGGSSYLWNNSQTTQSITVTSSGIFDVTVTSPNGCIATSPPITVSVSAPQIPSITPIGSTTLCGGGSVILSASSGASYLWSNSLTSQNIVVSTSGTYAVMVTNAAGCSAVSPPITVSVNALPTVSGGPNQSICAGTSVTLNGTGAVTYSWNNGVINGVPFTPSTTQTYTVTGTDANGCTNTASVTVTVNPLPAVSGGPNQSICAGTSVTLNGTGAVTYSWNNGVINGVPFAPSTTQTYIVTGTDANGCTNTASVTVTVNPLPAVSGGPNQSICAGTSVTLNGTGAVTYSWNNGVINGVPFAPSTTQTYTVTGTDANGCTNTASVTVTVNPLPAVSGGPNQSICAGTSVTLNGTGAVTYSWNNGVINGVPFAPSTTQTYTITGTDANGCTNTAFVTVTVNPIPNPVIQATGTSPYCPGANILLSTTPIPGCSYQWYIGSTLINGATSPTYTANISGLFKVQVITSSGCAVFSNTINITYLNPNIIALGPTTLCQGGSVVLQATSGAGFQYTWFKSGMPMLSTVNSSTFTVTSPGSYMVKIVTPNGCVMYSNTIIVTFIPNPTANISAQGPIAFCQGGSVTLTASNNANPVIYQWQYSPNVTGPWTTAGGVSTGQNYTATQIGYYRVVISNQLCPTTSSVISNSIFIQVFPLPPTPTISASTLIIGPGGSSTLTTISGMLYTYWWEKSPATPVGGNSNTYTTLTAGTFRVKVSNMYNCFKWSNWITIGSSMMPEPGVICLSDGIHVKHSEGLPRDGTWYREMENEIEPVSSVWNESEKEWILFGIDEGNFVYVTEEGDNENKWLRITDICAPKTIVVYPNPTNNIAYVKGLDDSEKYFELHDVMGRVVAIGNISAAQNAIDMSDLAPGTYRLVLQGYGVIAIVKE